MVSPGFLSTAIVLLIASPAVAQQVELATVTSKKLNRAITISGALEPHRRTLQSRVEGSVENLAAQPGQRVSKSELLLMLDSPNLTARLNAAKQEVSSAESAKIHNSANAAAVQAHADALTAAARPGDPATA